MEELGAKGVHISYIMLIKGIYDGVKTQVRTEGGDRTFSCVDRVAPRFKP